MDNNVTRAERVLADAKRQHDAATSRLDEAQRELSLALAEASTRTRASAETK
jgi:hypothetical protein